MRESNNVLPFEAFYFIFQKLNYIDTNIKHFTVKSNHFGRIIKRIMINIIYSGVKYSKLYNKIIALKAL